MKVRPLNELRSTGVLWAINRVVFHPRGYALALSFDDDTGECNGWALLGDGTEQYEFKNDETHVEFRAFEQLLTDAGAEAVSDE